MVIGWGFWSQRAARVAHRIYAAVAPLPMKISSHPQVSNRSISLQPQIVGDVKADLLRQYRPAGCGNPSPTGRLLIGWGFWSQRAARVAHRANAAVPPQLGRIRSHPQVRNLSIYLQFQQPGGVQKSVPVRYHPTGWVNPSPTGRLLIGWGFWSQRGARVAPRANAAVPLQPGKIRSHSQVRNPKTSLHVQLPGDVNANPRVNKARQGVKTPVPPADW